MGRGVGVTERSLATAAEAIAQAGYAYVADPGTDEPYDGRQGREWWVSALAPPEGTWVERFFPFQRSAYRRSEPGERASQAAGRP